MHCVITTSYRTRILLMTFMCHPLAVVKEMASVYRHKCIHDFFVVFGGFVSTYISMGFVHSIGVLHAELLDYFNFSRSDTSWITSLGSGTMMLFGDKYVFLFFLICAKYILQQFYQFLSNTISIEHFLVRRRFRNRQMRSYEKIFSEMS